jgi:arylsulfatase A-like enzyme
MDPLPGRQKEEDSKERPEQRFWNPPLYDGEKLVDQPADQTTLTRRYTERAVKFIEEKKGGPFFLYFPHTFPHTPLFASEEFRGKSPRGIYGDVVAEIDWSVGRVLDAVRAAGIEKNTFVFFSSDNGPWLIRDLAGGSAGLLRDGKGSTWEGGMRVPGIAWMPGKVPAGSVCREVAATMDLFTTCAKWAGAKVPGDRPIDGLDITALLTATGSVQRDAFFFYRGTRLFAARVGKWKAHLITQPSYGPGQPEPHDPPLLFDLAADPGESHNAAAQQPEVLAQIAAAIERHRATLAPVPNQLEAAVVAGR